MIREIVTRMFTDFQRTDQPVFTGSGKASDPEHYAGVIWRAISWGWSPKIDRATRISDCVKWFREGVF
jgi:hypothetical protein